MFLKEWPSTGEWLTYQELLFGKTASLSQQLSIAGIVMAMGSNSFLCAGIWFSLGFHR